MKTGERDQMQFNKANLKKMMGEIHKEASEEAQREMELKELEGRYGKIKSVFNDLDTIFWLSFWVVSMSAVMGIFYALDTIYHAATLCLFVSLINLFLMFKTAGSIGSKLSPIQKGQFVLTEDTERIRRLAKQME